MFALAVQNITNVLCLWRGVGVLPKQAWVFLSMIIIQED
ncbi:hypothetical protein U14_02773 [Candidatus Moduliflexus flocculans]|uniref:Uncharacterized protein n=1 Tax=Candidatus Moduliflexus flocculans TaxID=1499966 RepID=A0A081BMB2_9BACT|nr:hypothetical protein U14_02773 [Candidatus Moduliflexus flocculans]